MLAKGIFVLVLAGLMTGCATQSFVFDSSVQGLGTKETSHFFIGGIGQEDTINVADVCGSSDNVARVESHQSFLNGVLVLLTQGIYTPRQTVVYCKAGTK